VAKPKGLGKLQTRASVVYRTTLVKAFEVT
jgi:hypothetical protein